MKKIKKTAVFFLMASIFILSACKKDKKETDVDDPNINVEMTNKTLDTYVPQPTPNDRFRYTYSLDFDKDPLKIDCSLGFVMSWERNPNGYYLHFNNSVGQLLVNSNGFAKAFDKGATIDGSLSGWNSDGALAYDYVNAPNADKGELAGKGDKYFAVKLIDGRSSSGQNSPYYGWVKVNVAANGRDVKVLEVGFQTTAGKALKTGDK